MANIPFLNNAYFSAKVGIGTDSPIDMLSLERITNVNVLTDYKNSTGNFSAGVLVGGNFAINESNVATRLTIEKTSGNVGIGTTSPGTKLEISSTSDALLELNGGTTANPYMLFAQNGTRRAFIQYVNGGLLSLASEYGDIRFMTGTGGTETEKMRINSSGNVGIGNTSPADRLDLYDADDNVGIYFHTATSGTGGGNGLRVGQNNANAFVWNYEATPLSLATGGTARLTINATGGIRFNTGYGAGTLVTDASGNIIVSSGGGAGGPYLPLAGGTMTGDLFIEGASTPKITITDTTNNLEGRIRVANNYMYIEADNSDAVVSTRIVLKTDGVEALYLNGNQDAIFPNGNVGIGTTSPSQKLEVSTSNYNVSKFVGNTDDGTGYVGAVVEIESNNDARGRGVYLTHRNATDTSDNEWYAGVPYTGDGYSIGNAVYATSINSAAGPAHKDQSKLFIENTGNVGIGTTSPVSKLQVGDYMASNVLTIGGWYGGGGGTLAFKSGYVPNAAYVWDTARIKATDDGNFNGRIEFQTTASGGNGGGGSPTTKMVLKANGNVGIGNTSPDFRLHTNLNLSGSPLAYLNGTSNTFDATANLGVTHNSTAVGTGTAAGVYLANNANDNGAPSPIVAFSALSASGTYNHTYAAIYGIKTAGGADTNWVKGDLTFATGNTTGPERRMTIDSTGNVGIGTTSPDTKLHVEGNVLIDAYNQGEDNGLFFREGFLTIDQPSITVWDMSNSGASPDGLSINSQDGIRFRENGGEVARFKDGSFGIGTTSPSSKLQVDGGIQMADDTATASAAKVGTLKYRVSGNNSYVDMCMQTGATTYAWINIVQNNW